MSSDDRERWHARHTAAGSWDAGTHLAPPELLGVHLDDVPVTGWALDVACGRGLAAVWLAQRGLTVDAIDIAPAALRAGAALAAARGVTERVRWIAHDLDTGLPGHCQSGYSVVLCHRFRDPALYGALADALAPGGLLTVAVLSEVGARPGRFRAPPGELRAAFAGLDVLGHEEGQGQATLLARCRVGTVIGTR